MANTVAEKARELNEHMKYIKKSHQVLFTRKHRKNLEELRPHKVLVSLSERDIQEAHRRMEEGEKLATHVYEYYKKGVDDES